MYEASLIAKCDEVGEVGEGWFGQSKLLDAFPFSNAGYTEAELLACTGGTYDNGWNSVHILREWLAELTTSKILACCSLDKLAISICKKF